MKETVFATYERKSTLWKNANAFYVAQDWVKMECLFVDYSSNRSFGRVIDTATGEDITDKRGTNSRSLEFATREEANEGFKAIRDHKNLPGWKRVG